LREPGAILIPVDVIAGNRMSRSLLTSRYSDLRGLKSSRLA
jgi:hypothetical protein